MLDSLKSGVAWSIMIVIFLYYYLPTHNMTEFELSESLMKSNVYFYELYHKDIIMISFTCFKRVLLQ